MSSLTFGGAVAVSASTGGVPSARTASPRPRYAGRKSWPHCEMQCASSTTNSATRTAARRSRNRGSPRRSGVTYAMHGRFSDSRASAACSSRGDSVESRRSTSMSSSLELVVLILHQRDQRRHDERDAVELERGQLVAQRLAGAGRHDRERVDAGEHVADRERLAGAERARCRTGAAPSSSMCASIGVRVVDVQIERRSLCSRLDDVERRRHRGRHDRSSRFVARRSARQRVARAARELRRRCRRRRRHRRTARRASGASTRAHLRASFGHQPLRSPTADRAVQAKATTGARRYDLDVRCAPSVHRASACAHMDVHRFAQIARVSNCDLPSANTRQVCER